MKADVESFLTLFLGTGYDDATAARALAIGYAESNATATAVSPPNRNGSVDFGFLQINSVHFGETEFKRRGWNALTMLQLGPNIDAGRFLSDGWKNWKPWSTFNSNSYMKFVPQAEKDVADWHHKVNTGQLASAPAVVKNTVGAAASTADTVGGFVHTITQAGTWVRIGYGVAGILLIVLAAQRFVPNSLPIPAAKIAKGIKGAVGTAKTSRGDTSIGKPWQNIPTT